VLKFDQFYYSSFFKTKFRLFLVNVRMRKLLIYAIWSCEILGSLQIDIAHPPTKLACVGYCPAYLICRILLSSA